ncbi:MAG: hypothetical protein ABFD54_09370 [Armatimonadota bacterium]|nr:hypothetical protein [bacterium]
MFFKISPCAVVAAALFIAVWPALPSHAQSDTASAILEAARASATAGAPKQTVEPKSKPVQEVKPVAAPVQEPSKPSVSTVAAEPAQPHRTINQTMSPPQPKKRKFRLDPAVSVYYPTSDKTVDTFGNGWLGFGISFGLDDEIVRKDSFDLRIEGIAKNDDDGHAFIIPIGVAYTHRMSAGRKFKPYLGAGVSAYVADIESQTDNVDSGTKVTPGASVFVGTSIGSAVRIEANYYAISDVEDYDLGGVKLSASVRF